MSRSDVVEKLYETKKLRNMVLARKIDKIQQDPVVSRRSFDESEKLKKRAYLLFLKLIDSDTSKKIFDLDGEISMLKSTISGRTGWWFTGGAFIYQDNFQNMDDPEFRTMDTYIVPRTESGFELNYSDEPFNSYYACIRAREVQFVEQNKNELAELHRALKQKEKIMNGAFDVKDPDSYPLAYAICRYLGYYGDSNKLPKKIR